MSFKDDIRDDINETFLDTDEFFTLHYINERKMPILIDDNELMKRTHKQNSGEGIYVKKTLIYVRAKDFGLLPRPESIIKIDGRPYRVLEATNEFGMYSIQLEVNVS